MAYNLYEYMDEKGENLFKRWREKLDLPLQMKLAQKMNMLRTWAVGDELPPNLITGTSIGEILKMRVYLNVQLRPRLCRGPVDRANEFSFLLGAVEIGNKTKPATADAQSAALRKEIMQHKDLRRCPYVAPRFKD